MQTTKLTVRHTDSSFTDLSKKQYLPLDGMVNMPTYLVWASWVQNGTTFLSDNRYFEIQT